MKLLAPLKSVQLVIAVVAFLIATALLVMAIYFTAGNLEWTAFLSGILVASALAVVSRAARSEARAAQQGENLAIARVELTQETAARQEIDKALAEARSRLELLDKKLPALVAYVDTDGTCRYHNEAFGRWVDLPPHRIDGQHMRNVLGKGLYAAMESELDRAAAGEVVRTERTQKMPNGSACRLQAAYLPVSASGKSTGFFMLMADLAGAQEKPAAAGAQAAPAGTVHPPAGAAEETFAASVAQQATGWSNARERIMAAIERNEFTLFCQPIAPLAAAQGQTGHYEILIRLLEEEHNLIPPGAFFPLAEEHGLLPQLDRWVVANVLRWAASHGRHHPPARAFFINLAAATMKDPDFADSVLHELNKCGLPGATLCFEVSQSGLEADRGDVQDFIRRIRPPGCRIALSGFGRDSVSVEVLKTLRPDFLKLDGGTILHVATDPLRAGKISAISRVARGIGIATVAEMVENDETIRKLRDIGVDYAQGFGIARPGPLAELAAQGAPVSPL